MDNETKVKGCLICSAISVVILLLLAAFSFSTVEPTEYGLKFNTITRSIQNNTGNLLFVKKFIKLVYDGGRYWIWPWNSFLIFPRTLQTIEFNDPSRSRSINDKPINTRT